MTGMTYTTHERMLLKNHPEFNEKWLQDRIAEDPTILGLGDVFVLDRERTQERAGRLDILLSSPEQDRRYEVELMLGATDESHIIRCIEYWDIERRRYPGYEHCAVLVAEDITSRFLNVIGLLAGTVPLVAIQLNALSVGDNIVLDFVRVLDQRLLRRDDTTVVTLPNVDRAYWIQKASESVIRMADELLEIINEQAEPKQHLTFNKHYIGLSDGARSKNFIKFRPRKNFLRVVIPGEWTARTAQLEEAGIDAEQMNNPERLRFKLSSAELKKHRELVAAVIHEVVVAQSS